MERFSMSNKLYVTSDILNAVMNGMNYSKQRANTWIKHFIVDSIRGEIVYINDIPHRNKDIDYNYVKSQLSAFHVGEACIEDFFNRNFHYSESVIPSKAKYEFEETVGQAAAKLTTDTIDYSDDLNSIKELL